MKGPIIAIGGGKMYTKETLVIDRYIVALAKKNKPKALFIPTASKDSPDYCNSFKKIYGDLLNCEIDYLLLANRANSNSVAKIITDKIKKADLIYVGGGSTLFLMKTWRSLGVDKALNEAHCKGKILAGMSAGSICWYEGGYSDSFKNKYAVIRGLGLLKGHQVPHFNDSDVRSNFTARLKDKAREKKWYALSDNSALVYTEKKIHFIKSNKAASAYEYTRGESGAYIKKILS